MQNDRTILVAEDDNNTCRGLQHDLKRSGDEVTEAASVDESLQSVFAHLVELVILDFDISGGTADVLTKIRRRSSVPVIVCSGRSTERDRVGLRTSVRTTCSRSLFFAELEARMRAVLRRGSATPTTTLDHGDLVIDQGHAQGHGQRRRGDDDPQGIRPARLLGVGTRTGLLTRGPARACVGIQRPLAGALDGDGAHPPVRLKIETDPENPRWITTIRGIGYRFAAPPS